MATAQQLNRWDPFGELDTMRRLMDRMWGQPVRTAAGTSESPGDNLALDVYEQNGNLVVKAAVPGVKPDDLSVTFEDGVLTIRGSTRAEKDVEDNDYHLREYAYGSFTRSVRLPADVDTDKAVASVADGMLRLTIPRKKGRGPKHITVKSS